MDDLSTRAPFVTPLIAICFAPSFVISCIYGGAVYESRNLNPPVPYSWFIVASRISLGEVVLLPPVIYLFMRMSIGWFILLSWSLTLLAPFIIYHFKRESLIYGRKRGIADAEILDMVRRYGGILTLSVVISKAKIRLEDAR